MNLFFYYFILPIILLVPCEFVVYYIHKYIMHGFGWSWHKSHHEKHGEKLEKNDLYFMVFSLIDIFFFLFSLWIAPYTHLFSMIIFSVAISWGLYGALTFILHEVFFHKRIKNDWAKTATNPYLKRLIKAHSIHHQDSTKAFGLLYASKHYKD